MNTAVGSQALVPFRWPDFRRLFVAAVCSTLASRGLAVVLGYEVYELTRSPLSLGILGLVEAVPALSLALYGGHVADRADRRRILRRTLGALIVCAGILAFLETTNLGKAQLVMLYGVDVSGRHRPRLCGTGRGGPRSAASRPVGAAVDQFVDLDGRALWMTAAVIGPMIGGVAFAKFGIPPGRSSAWGRLAMRLAWIAVSRMAPAAGGGSCPADESVWQSVATGVRYVVRDQVLLGSMSLDLFAVLFGGAIALLPVFARDILGVGKIGLGCAQRGPNHRCAPCCRCCGAAGITPVRHAGRNLFCAVAGFGVSMIVFALSRSFALSVAALIFSGIFDGVSVVIRRGILRLLSPNHLRGRIASVSMIFIGSSNELGAFESGITAALLGTARSVWMGGIVTLVVVAVSAALAPRTAPD